MQALPVRQRSRRGAAALKCSKPDGNPVTDDECHVSRVKFRWYHGLLFALSRKAQGVFWRSYMEFRFELPEGYSYQDVLALMRVLIRKRKIGRWVRLLSRIFLISAGCILLWISCSQWNRVREGYALLLAAMIVGILGVATGVFVYSAHVAAWLSWRMQAKDKGRICICLDDSVLTEESKKGTEIRPYSAFQEAYLYKKYWILFQNNYHAKILPQTAMTTGNPENFPAFWVEKTGMSIKTIR